MQGYSITDNWWDQVYHLKNGVPRQEDLTLSCVLGSFEGGRATVGRIHHGSGYKFEPIDGAACLGVETYFNALRPVLMPSRSGLPSVGHALNLAAFILKLTADVFHGVGAPFDFAVLTDSSVDEFSSEDRPQVMAAAEKMSKVFRQLFEIASGPSNSPTPAPSSGPSPGDGSP